MPDVHAHAQVAQLDVDPMGDLGRPWVNAEKLMDYDGVKRHVRTYLTNKRTFRDAARTHHQSAGDSAGSQDPVPMDLSVLRSSLSD